MKSFFVGITLLLFSLPAFCQQSRTIDGLAYFQPGDSISHFYEHLICGEAYKPRDTLHQGDKILCYAYTYLLYNDSVKIGGLNFHTIYLNPDSLKKNIASILFVKLYFKKNIANPDKIAESDYNYLSTFLSSLLQTEEQAYPKIKETKSYKETGVFWVKDRKKYLLKLSIHSEGLTVTLSVSGDSK